ncbi:MAG: hypothetical protein WCG04_02495 [Alphaproteobacteria bacterium]
MKLNEYLAKATKGSTLTEYAVILGLIALVGWGAISALGVDTANVFSFLSAGKTSAQTENTKGLGNIKSLGK